MGKVKKLVVEVVAAHNLMPKDGQGTSSAFVEVDYDNRTSRTPTKEKTLNPVWNEKLMFDVPNPMNLQNQFLQINVWHEKNPPPGRKFLGRLKIQGSSIKQGVEVVQKFTLEKRGIFWGIFSVVKGDIELKFYTFDEEEKKKETIPQIQWKEEVKKEKQEPKEEEKPEKQKASEKLEKPEKQEASEKQEKPEKQEASEKEEKSEKQEVTEKQEKPEKQEATEKREKPEKKGATEMQEAIEKQEVTGKQEKSDKQEKPEQQEAIEKPMLEVKDEPKLQIHKQQASQPSMSFVAEKRPDPEPVIMHNIHSRSLDYELKETSPHLGDARVKEGRWFSGERTSSTYDLVEQMEYLYVRVEKARDLSAMNITGTCDPYVEVRLGNYKGTTKHFEKKANPEWKQVFAFSKNRIQASTVEIVVRDKRIGMDESIGYVTMDLNDVPTRVPPDSPLAPQWYKLKDGKGDPTHRSELMLAVWMGTQADEAFSEAWHSEAATVRGDGVANLRSKVYMSPKLWYVRVNVIEAQDLLPSDKGRSLDVSVKVQLGHQLLKTKKVHTRATNPMWNEDLIFVAAEPFEEQLILSVEDRIREKEDEVIGRKMIHLPTVEKRLDYRTVNSKWFTLERHNFVEGEQRKKENRFSSRIHLRVCLEGGYHVLDESTHYSSDLRPTAKELWNPAIGNLEVGILNAKTLLPMKMKGERGTTDAYCVAKYGQKWVRTRTCIDSFNPKWNEQYTWEVYDPCTVLTVGVFDNCHLQAGAGAKDSKIGKIRIRLSTLEIDRIYTNSYPLLVLHSSGVKKMGELELAVRFSCSSLANVMHLYTYPLLPKMHYLYPFSVSQLENLRHQAMNIVEMRLSRAEPPLTKEVVEYMIDGDSHMWSMRRSKANFFRIMSVLSPLIAVGKWFNDICHWKNPITTVLVHLLFFILICYPELVLPTIFLYMFLIGIWHFRYRPRLPAHMDTRLSHAEGVHPDELDEEFDTFPSKSNPQTVTMRYVRLRSVAGRIQTVVGDIATQGERFQSLLSWRDPRATTMFIIFCLFAAIVLYITPFRVVALLAGLHALRHPRFRHKLPSVPINFFRRLPARTDSML